VYGDRLAGRLHRELLFQRQMPVNTMQLNADKDSPGAENNNTESQQAVRQLRCRGCTASCGLYATCNRAPWRMSIAVPSADQGDD
jgi:hypothetical protein